MFLRELIRHDYVKSDSENEKFGQALKTALPLGPYRNYLHCEFVTEFREFYDVDIDPFQVRLVCRTHPVF